MAFDETEQAAQRELTRLAEARAFRGSAFCAFGIICFALTMGLPNHILTFLVLTLLGLIAWGLYERVLRHAALYRRIYQVCQAHYRGENAGELLHTDDLGENISRDEQQRFEELVRLFKNS